MGLRANCDKHKVVTTIWLQIFDYNLNPTPRIFSNMTKYTVVRQGSKYNDRPTLYGFNKVNDNEGPIADQYEFVGTWNEVEEYAKNKEA